MLPLFTRPLIPVQRKVQWVNQHHMSQREREASLHKPAGMHPGFRALHPTLVTRQKNLQDWEETDGQEIGCQAAVWGGGWNDF